MNKNEAHNYLNLSYNYYPFGSVAKGRSFSSTAYRYGFNGKEKDNEVSGDGNEYDYGMRIYDARLGRFVTIDPLSKEYPGLTTYQFGSNSPIWMIDVDGLEGNPYNGDVPELPADGGRYGKRGIDWDAVANPPGEVPIAVKNAGIGPEGKYYWSPTTDVSGRVIWQKPVQVTTCEMVEYKVTKTVTEIIPAIPPGHGTKMNSTPPLTGFNDSKSTGGAIIPSVVIPGQVAIASFRADAAKKAGNLVSIDIQAKEKNNITQGIVKDLQKKYGVIINVKYDAKLTSDYVYKANYTTPTTTPGQPAQIITKEVEEVKTKRVCDTQTKQ